MSVLHGGLGIVGVSRAVTNFMITDDMEMASCHLTVEDVPDYNIQLAVTEVRVHFALQCRASFSETKKRESSGMLIYDKLDL